ncbi:DUF2894 domain-containing protein [Noviherbaspirillum sp.]|uniref:DUF2894 domain-containing protein n=1 Tax=Noviherbaspirillum sp. TaxID=1926288 RepID=UPI002B49B3C2|nr:DUF2894 domain-containing protein [Noviherbaspirillum sp.]
MDFSSGSPADVDTMIASLRAAGVDRFDPARLHYVEALARRARAHRGSVRRMLDARLAQALAALKERFELVQSDARETVARNAERYPHAAVDLQRLVAAGEFRELRQAVATLQTREQCALLGELVRRLEHSSSGTADGPLNRGAAQRAELKTVRHFRNTFSRLSVDKQVAQALEQAPRNAGPINSHMLVLRSLALMRDISPDYLNRFMSYADTLLRLDQGEKEKPVSGRKSPAAKAAKK